jgi:hypothetical protein
MLFVPLNRGLIYSIIGAIALQALLGLFGVFTKTFEKRREEL